MAPLVTFSAPSLVKIGHVTYKMENVWDVNLGYMAVTANYRVLPTVKITRVTYRMEHVIHVNRDGQAYTVKQVIVQPYMKSKYEYLVSYYVLFHIKQSYVKKK